MLIAAGMDGLFEIVVLIILASPLIAFALRRTGFGLIPGSLLMFGAVLLLVTIRPVHDDVGGIGALGNGIQAIGGIAIGLWGLISFALGRPRSRKPAVPALPVARAR